ncbi:RagB/SusD family nutrient uptake outer membrane protein [Antarcticibacterium sp. 1MA-6-2]|uniref:RagB/SusD family nutrient uptake outer membrane protein n=1 Tax=Antarcticibacterium sp. 1MA-6-2 TaxID=2908210 RepID=UPI001F1FB419|nr:RagB/SusD family nutrient uptake outer membrane protein [Antarcticibacterium sp. 1MA-6-2]UJH90741.1 RagB/SusD family nutrient uptake outer membrane protein [Antarcticibacterium sp. 1MA-6-2]
MKKHVIVFLIMAIIAVGCTSDQEFLDREPTNILTEDQIFSDPELPVSILADLYNRYHDFGSVEQWWTLADFNQAFYSNQGDYWRFQNPERGYGDWGTWDYGYIRHMNLFIERLEASEALDEEDRNALIAETRFLRASYYFTLVKRMGGVPLITESLTYDFSGDPTYLQTPRSTEAEIYDFVIQEAEEIKDMLPANANRKSRATKGAVLAMQSRAALYA